MTAVWHCSLTLFILCSRFRHFYYSHPWWCYIIPLASNTSRLQELPATSCLYSKDSKPNHLWLRLQQWYTYCTWCNKAPRAVSGATKHSGNKTDGCRIGMLIVITAWFSLFCLIYFLCVFSSETSQTKQSSEIPRNTKVRDTVRILLSNIDIYAQTNRLGSSPCRTTVVSSSPKHILDSWLCWVRF